MTTHLTMSPAGNAPDRSSRNHVKPGASWGVDTFLKAPRWPDTTPPCCPDGPPETYPIDDDGDWIVPEQARRMYANSKYLLHERRHFHSIGIHSDTYIADRLAVPAENLRRTLNRAGLPTNFA